MKFFKTILLASVVLATFTAQAAVGEKTVIKLKNNKLLSKVVIEEIAPEESLENKGLTGGNSYSLPDLASDLDQTIMIVDKLIAVGTKIWKIVEANKPVVDTNFAPTFSVLPKGVQDNNSFDLMYGWSDPLTKSYQVSYKNVYGMTVINFKVAITMQYAGKDGNGKGKYLASVSVVPTNVDVAWGYTFNAKSTLVSITNKGTRIDPIAAANLQIDYTVKTVVKESRSSIQFHLDGKGTLKALNL